MQANFLTISQLKPCGKYQITVTPIMANAKSGFPAKTEATVMAEEIKNTRRKWTYL